MRLFFRFLLWLSMTVLPFQGSTAMAIGQSAQVGYGTAVMADHQQHPAAERTGGEHCTQGDSKATTSSHAKCGDCASCSVGAVAPPALLPPLHVLPLASSLHPIEEAAMTSIVPAGLERPPRLDFA
jgi:hypothetical protein